VTFISFFAKSQYCFL